MLKIVYRTARRNYPGMPLLKGLSGFFHSTRRFLFIWVSLLLLSNVPAKATHLMGGSITYTYAGKTNSGLSKYNIKVDIFRDCNSPTPFDDQIYVSVFERKRNGSGDTTSFDILTMYLQSDESVNPPSTGCCGSGGNTSDNICIHEGIYTSELDVAPSNYGYYLEFVRCCRNTMVNVPNNIGQTYFAIIPPTNIANSTPQFTAVPAPYICVNDTISLSYAAFDPDGDSLVYSLVQPYAGADSANPFPIPATGATFTPIPLVPYNTFYSPQFPLGNAVVKGYASVNKITGILTVYATKTGRYAIAVDVKEYRNGKYISKTRRDVQLIVIGNCGLNDAPKRIPISDTIPIDKNTSTIYKIEAGTKLIFGIRYQTDNSKPSQCPINITSVKTAGFINNSGGFTNPPLLSPVVLDTINHLATLYFYWQTACKDANPNPYTFTVTVTDDACPPKTTTQGFAIYVVPFQGANKILGPNPACQGTPAKIYSTNYQQKYYQLTWKVSGGAYSKGPNDSSISVIWGKNATGTIKVIGKNIATGCAGDSVIKTIKINPKPLSPIINSPQYSCVGNTSFITIHSGSSLRYSWKVAGGSVTPLNNQENFVQIKWTKADTNSILVTGEDSNGCGSDTSLAATIVEQPIADSIFGSYSVCPNSSGIDYWVTSQKGSTYYWKVSGGTQATGGNTSHITINWGNRGGGLVKVKEITAHGCPGDTLMLNVLKDYKLYTSAIKGDTSLCEFAHNVPYSCNFSNGSRYAWKISGGTIIAGQGTANILVDWDKAGNGALMVTETAYDPVNHDSCIGIPVSSLISIYPVPNTSEISGPAGICEGNIALYSVNGLPGSTYTWKFHGKKSIYTTDSARFQDTDLVNLTDTVHVEVTELSKHSCPGATRYMVVTVHKLPVTSAITGPDLICAPNLNAAYQVTGFPTSTFNWTVSGGVIATGDKTNKITVNWYQAGKQSVKVQEVSDFGCVAPLSQAKNLTVRIDSLDIDMQLVTTDYNNDKEIDLFWSAKNTDFFNGYFRIYRSTQGQEFFRLIDSVPATQTYYTDKNVNTSAYAYRYHIMAVNSCGYPVHSSTHRSIKLAGTFDQDTTIRLNWNRYEGWPVDVYNINEAQDQDVSFSLYNFTKDTQFVVIKTLDGYQLALRISAVQAGLNNVVSWSNKIIVDFNPLLWIPNAFTPQNGDNINNTFHIFVANYKSFQVNIYNRWGEHIFSSNDPNKQWDGTFKGAHCVEGVYLYQVVVGGAKTDIYRNGTLTLMR